MNVEELKKTLEQVDSALIKIITELDLYQTEINREAKTEKPDLNFIGNQLVELQTRIRFESFKINIIIYQCRND